MRFVGVFLQVLPVGRKHWLVSNHPTILRVFTMGHCCEKNGSEDFSALLG